MNKSAVAGALIALTGSALVAPSIAAADPTPPVVSFDGGDATLSERQGVTVSGIDSSAVRVRLTYADLPAEILEVHESEEVPDTFAATGFLETWGLTGPHDLVVAQCTDTAGTECGTLPSTTVATTVNNPAPTHELSRPGTEFSESFNLTVHLAHVTGAPRIKLTTDNGTPEYVDPEDVHPVDTVSLLEGPHQIDIAVCSEDELRCTPGETVAFEVVTGVLGAFSVSPLAFSPNGDGLPDTVDFGYTRLGPWTSAKVEARNAADVLVFDSAVPVPEALATENSFTYDGKDGLGGFLPDGAYTARLVVTRTLDSGDVVSSTYDQTFAVDSTALAPLKLTPSPSTFYPSPDGYRDTTKFTYTGRETYSRVDLQVFDSDFDPVRTKQILVPADASWNGRNDAGVRVPAAYYKARLRVVDALGNVGFTPLATIKVSNAALVTVTKNVTIMPKASKVSGQVGSCSTRRTPSVHGWAGSTSYLSNTRCRRTFNASIVWTHNKVRLPSAVKYRWVRLGWYGGPTRAVTHHRASAALYGPDFGTPQGWFRSLDYMAGQYLPTVPASQVLNDGYVHWGFQTDSGNRYDVKSFTITYRADVLR